MIGVASDRGILQPACGGRHRKAQHQNESGDDCLRRGDHASHGSMKLMRPSRFPRTGDTLKAIRWHHGH
jgi:hypothetical protein